MRPYVIVTLQSLEISGTYDMEIPTDTPAEKIASDIMDTIQAYRGESVFAKKKYVLYCERLNKALADRETFAEAGIWNGDIIRMKGKE